MADEHEDTLGGLLRTVREGKETVFDVIRTAAAGEEPATTRIEVSRRQLQAEPPKARERTESPRRAHAFHGLEGFRSYLAKYGSKDTVVLADVLAREILAVLDETANTGFEVLTLKPMVHPLLAPWLAMVERCEGTRLEGDEDDEEQAPEIVTLDDFVQFVAANRRVVVEPDGKALALVLSQVRCSTSVTLQRGRGAKCVNGLKVATEIQGERSGEDLVDLPDTLVLECPVFVDGAPRRTEFDLTLSALAGGTGIRAQLTSADLAAAMVEEFQAMVDGLSDGAWTVGLGRPEHAEWKYL